MIGQITFRAISLSAVAQSMRIDLSDCYYNFEA